MKPLAILLIDDNYNPKLMPIKKKWNPWRDPIFLICFFGAIVTGILSGQNVLNVAGII